MAQRHQDLFVQLSAPWSAKRYKEVTLSRLLIDLGDLEDRGLEEVECLKIKKALKKAYNIAESLPDESRFCKAFWEDLIKMYKLYEQWNSVPRERPDANELRQKQHRQMIDLRKGMWRRFPRKSKRNGVYFDRQLDLLAGLERSLLDDMHLAFKEAVEAHPEIFPSLRKEIIWYERVVAETRR